MIGYFSRGLDNWADNCSERMPLKHQPNSLRKIALRSICRNFNKLFYRCQSDENMRVLIDTGAYMEFENPLQELLMAKGSISGIDLEKVFYSLFRESISDETLLFGYANGTARAFDQARLKINMVVRSVKE
ncbi:hypothetical protein J6590_043654 [Homalodisca vitripennis]|nr:hypothetical protein J6590_043654 [Homalodisca vitripennis]